jgi:hypothetical protein
MTRGLEEKNKALVLRAFDTLFNRRDYAAAERFWSPQYIQHSAHIAPGRDGLFDLIRSLPPTLKYEAGTIVSDGSETNERVLSDRVGCASRVGSLQVRSFSVDQDVEESTVNIRTKRR